MLPKDEMMFVSEDEPFYKITDYIYQQGTKYGLGNEDDCRHISNCEKEFIVSDALFKKLLAELKKRNLINIVFVENLPLFDDNGVAEGGFYPNGDLAESEMATCDFFILDLEGLKKYGEELFKKYPKRPTPLIKLKALEIIAIKIAELDTGEGLVKSLKECGVNEKLIIYPNTKWRMVNDIFGYLGYSALEADHRILFNIFEEFCHPLRFSGDKEKSLEIQDDFSNVLQYDGFVVVNGKVVKITDELIKEIDDRRKRREDEKSKAPVDEHLQRLISDMFNPPVRKQNINRPFPTPAQTPLQVEITKMPETHKVKENKPKKPPIFISRDYGIYKNENTKIPKYPISGQRSEYLWKLQTGKKSGKELNDNAQILSAAIIEINKLFKKTLGLKDDLIISLPTVGYKLNNEKFDIKFIETGSGC